MPQQVSRRTTLQIGFLGLAGASLPNGQHSTSAAEQPASQADAVLFLNLAGGPSHLDTLDMKPGGPAETRGEFKPIQASLPGLVCCEHLPKIAHMSDQFSILRGISHSAGSHPLGQSYISTGNRPSPAVAYPSLGSIVAREMSGFRDLPPYIAIPQTEWNAGYMGHGFAPFKTNAVPKPGQPFSVRGISLSEGVTLEKVHRREALLQTMNTKFRDLAQDSQLVEALDTFGQQAHSMITSKRTQTAFDVAQEPRSLQKLFGANELEQSLLLATRLIEHGVRFVTVTNPGWDTHLDNFRGHRRLLPPFDAGLTAAITALQEKGLLARTLVVAMGEFGRTPKINENVGRDHYPAANWCVLAGGGVRSGQLIGSTDKAGVRPSADTEIAPDDIGASILHALGIDHHREYHTKSGRPVSLIPQGTPIAGLFG
ncbi:MAG: DUF1501 domain-containing protein [Planctomycetaceae bacterium]